MPSASAPRWRSPDAAKRFPTQLRAASRRSTQRIHAAPRRFATLRTASRRSAQRKVCSRGKTDSRVRQLLSTSELPGSPTGLPGSSKWNTFAKPCRTTVHYTGGSGEPASQPEDQPSHPVGTPGFSLCNDARAFKPGPRRGPWSSAARGELLQGGLAGIPPAAPSLGATWSGRVAVPLLRSHGVVKRRLLRCSERASRACVRCGAAGTDDL